MPNPTRTWLDFIGAKLFPNTNNPGGLIVCTVHAFEAIEVEGSPSVLIDDKMYVLRHYVVPNLMASIKSFRPISRSTTVPELDMNKSPAKYIVWVDLEMTGLEIEKDHIMEVACLITNEDLNVVAMGPNLVVHQPDEILKAMHPWCVNQHGETGLTEASRNSKITLQDAENQLLQFVKSYVPDKRCPLGGNSVYMDRLFLRKYMPTFNEYLHHRIIDVSTIKELARRWYQKEFSNIPQKQFKHRSIDDILESVKELKYYREHIFKSKVI